MDVYPGPHLTKFEDWLNKILLEKLLFTRNQNGCKIFSQSVQLSLK